MVAAGLPLSQTILLVGAGHAHVEVLRSFAADPPPDARIVLATRTRFTPYSGMLPGLIAGHYTFEEAHIDAQRLAETAGARFVGQAIVGFDLGARQARCADGTLIAYDILSIDIGIIPATDSVPGAADHVIPVKPIDEFLTRFDDLLDRFRSGDIQRIAVVGAGAGGVELALAVEHRLRGAADRDRASLALQIVCSSARILPGFPTGFARRLNRSLAGRGIGVLLNARVRTVIPGSLLFDDIAPLPVDAVLWVTEAAAPGWLGETGLPLDPSGFITVEAGLDVTGWPQIFAAGDVAQFTPRPLPKAGVYAVRQGPILASNIRRCLAGRRPIAYEPQSDALVLMSTGNRHAVGTRNGLVVEGDWVWRVKDWLDRRWVRRYQCDA